MSRRWLTMLAIAAAFAVACFYLGQWQWHRHEGKAARAQRIERHYTARPVPLSEAMPRPGVPLPQPQEWTTVTATGRYDAQHVMLVRNRPNNGIYGYDVVVPLQLANGMSLLVDRGWIPNGRTAADPSRAPATPSGEITVTGWLRLGEPSLGRQMTNGQLASINLAEAGTPGQRIEHAQALERPDTGQGPHLAYALQWWLGAPVGLVLVFVGVRRELVEGRAEPGPLRGGSPAPPSPVKVRKTRIWDEEDE